MKQRLPFLRNRSLYRRRTIKFDRLDPSLVETPFIDLSFRVERSPFQRRRSEKRPTSVFQKRAARVSPTKAPLLGEVNATRKTKRIFFYFIDVRTRRSKTTRSFHFIFNAPVERDRLSAFYLFSLFFRRRQASFSFNSGKRRRNSLRR